MKQIRCFVAAYEEGSFSKAAQREHCTQPGLSVYIQRLETLLTHRLFDRQARGVTPTIAGRRFYGYCTDVLRTVGIARQQMLEMAGSFATQINLGVPPTLFKGAVYRMLPDYMIAHPFVEVRLAEAYSGTLTEWVVSGEVEAAIVTRPPLHLGLESVHFFRDRLVLASRGRVAGKRQHVRPRAASELNKLKLILPSPRHSLRQIVENAAVQLGSSGSGRILEIDGMLGTLEMVRNSDWSTVVGSTAVMQDVKQGRLVAEPIYGPELWLDFYLIRTKDALPSVACQDFLDRLKATLDQVVQTHRLSLRALHGRSGARSSQIEL
ncbi:MAG TPA: LysR family transcriptional regulator [Terriglobales bacterium]|nr:LysR family transcriptional regulator [Terriglobales bacterium]